MTEQRHRLLAWLWLLPVLACAAHLAWLLLGAHLHVETDVLAMLPQDAHQGAALRATRALADAAERRVVVLIEAPDWPAAQRAGDAAAAQLVAPNLSLRWRVDSAALDSLLDFYGPHRSQMLSAAQRARLESTPPPQLAERALAQLYQPMGMPRVGSFATDPLNNFGAWLAERSQDSRVRVIDGRLGFEFDRHAYAVLMLSLADSAFSMQAQSALQARLDAAKHAAQTENPQAQWFAVGVPLFAAAAAQQAQHEVHVIGAGSLVGIVALTWFAFGGLRPRVLVMLSIGVGIAAAVSVCSLLFGGLHLITLVFGASLVGVAENYGSNYFSNRAGRPLSERFEMVREQAPTLWLALATTVIGYALLALTPFPGLRQIAVFSVVGLAAAFVTTLLWFPVLDGGAPQFTRFAAWIGGLRARWPQPRVWWLLPVAAVLLAGAWRLRIDDDIRSLQNAPPELLRQQMAVARVMDLPNPGRFFLIKAGSEETLLQDEEALVAHLRGAGVQVQAVSDWLPSMARQSADAALQARINAAVLREMSRSLGPTITQAPTAQAAPLRPADWLASPVSEAARHLWLGHFDGGYASVVMLRGALDAQQLSDLASLQMPGVQWIDKIAEISRVMRETRQQMSLVIAASTALVLLALWWRFGARGWRALAPTVLAGALSLALLALLGQPLQLFNVLALLLILGMGVDYGIFLLNQPDARALRPFLSITLAAASTLLAFGLLALSATPALRAFGLTMALGLTLAWALTPLFVGGQKNEQ